MGRLATAVLYGLALLAALVAGTPDYYAILGISKDADTAAIKSAYRKAALKWHPDKNPDSREEAEVKFREVAEAYEVLSDPGRRKQYDNAGSAGAGEMPHWDFPKWEFKNPNDIFKDFFGDKDPFANFDELFDTVWEEDSSASTEDKHDLVTALSTLYTLAEQHEKANHDNIREVLRMDKWSKKEKKLVDALKKKYPEPKYAQAFERIDKAVEAIEKSRSASKGRGGGDPFGGFGGFPDLGKMMGGNMESLFNDPGAGGGGLDDMFGLGSFADQIIGSFSDLGGGSESFSSFSSSSFTTSSFSSSSFSSDGTSKTVKSETKVVNGKRVTKTIESDGETTTAMMEEEEGGRVKRKKGVKKGTMEHLPGSHDEI